MSQPSDDHPASAQVSRRILVVAVVASVASFVCLFLIWPYQHGHLDYRSSLFKGILLLIDKADTGSEWIFCPAIPFVVGFLVWRLRKEVAQLPFKASKWAITVLLFALALYWLGYKAATRYIGFASAQTFLAGCLLLIGGIPLFRVLLFPWIFFVFTWPRMPLEELLALPLRHITTTASSIFLNLIGVDNIKQGTSLLSAPDLQAGLEEGEKFSLNVAAPCSGIRSLFALIMISAFYGYMSLKTGLKRFILFLCAIPLAMAGNFVRILMLSFGSMWFGAEWAIGSEDHPSGFHMFSGFCVFGVALSGLFGVAVLLNKTKLWDWELPPLPKGLSATEPKVFNQTIVRGGTLIALSLAAIMTCYATPVSHRLSNAGIKMELPTFFGAYYGKNIGMSSKEKQAFDEGVEMARSIFSDGDTQYMCTLVLSGPVKRSLHRPEKCLPGQGWEIERKEIVDLVSEEGKKEQGTMLHLFRDYEDEQGNKVRARAYNIFYYVGHDVATPSYINHVILSHRDSVFRNVNHRWGMVSFFAASTNLPISKPDPLLEITTSQRLIDFASDLVPEIQLF